MAALHLLPRELVHLLAASRPGTAASSSLHAGHRLSALLRLQRIPRFSSDYRRVALDSDTARDFDRPSSGYEYPSIAGAEEPSFLDEASFVEPDDAEYHSNWSPSISSAPQPTSSHSRQVENMQLPQVGNATLAVPLPKAHTQDLALSNSRMAMLALGNAANCLKRNDLDSAVAWFIDSPPVPSTFASQRMRLELLVSSLSTKLLEERSQDMSLLKAFAVAAASKGFSKQLLRVIPHISRFSTYEKLEPFWTAFTTKARDAYKSTKRESHLPALERSISRIGNRIVRSLCLSENYVDSLKFIRLLRADNQLHSNPTSPKAIEAETYRILMEELRRHKTHPSLFEEVKRFSTIDHPQASLGTPATMDAATAKKAKAPASEPVNMAQRQAQLAALAESASGHTLPSATSAKSEYLRLSRIAHGGYPIDAAELGRFAELCRRDDATYLQKSLARKMAMSGAERKHRDLIEQMQEGRLPSTSTLSAFIEHCLQGRQPKLVEHMGEWMQSRSMRFRSLWLCARIHRLISKESKKAAYDALQIYKEHFMYNGLPVPIVDFFKSTGSSPLTIPSSQPRSPPVLEQSVQLLAPEGEEGLIEPKEPATLDELRPSRTFDNVRVPASSHSIVLAIQAWLQFDRRLENVHATYESFINVSYAESEDVRTPTHLMPDQVSFGPFLKHLSRLDRTSDAMPIMHAMRKRGVMPNAHNWTTVLGGFAREGHRNMVSGIMKRMDKAVLAERHGASPQELDLDLVGAYNRNSRVPYYTASSPRAVNEVLDGFTFYPPTLATYVTVIRGLCLAGDLEKAKYYVRDMFAARTISGDRLYRFGENKQAEAALDVIMQMDKLATVGRLVTHRRTLKRYAYAR